MPKRPTAEPPKCPRPPTKGAIEFAEFRRKSGLSQERAGEALSVSGPTIHDWETGVKRPRGHHRDRIAVWTGGGVPSDWWMHDDEKKSVVPFSSAAGAR